MCREAFITMLTYIPLVITAERRSFIYSLRLYEKLLYCDNDRKLYTVIKYHCCFS